MYMYIYIVYPLVSWLHGSVHESYSPSIRWGREEGGGLWCSEKVKEGAEEGVVAYFTRVSNNQKQSDTDRKTDRQTQTKSH